MDEIHWFLSIIAVLGMVITLPGTLELLLVTLGNFLPFHHKPKTSSTLRKLAVIVPAHNEEKDIKNTLESIKKCSGKFDVLVIADNCDDSTAEIARGCGVRVLERQDFFKRGKPYALIYAFDRLVCENYYAYVIIDSDSVVEPNLIDEINKSLTDGIQAVQVTYLVEDSHIQTMKTRLLYLASVAFNYVRPSGRQKLGLSAGIHGNGFTLTRYLLEKVGIPENTVVEDLSYHFQIVSEGYFVAYNDNTRVYALPPRTAESFEQQRTRWEGGRMRMVFQELPRLLKSVGTGNWRLIEPLLDLLLLPLSYHVLILLLLVLIPFHFTQIYGLAALFLVLIHVTIAFIYGKCGWEDFKAILSVPPYLLWKLKFISKLRHVVKNGVDWIRTGRK